MNVKVSLREGHQECLNLTLHPDSTRSTLRYHAPSMNQEQLLPTMGIVFNLIGIERLKEMRPGSNLYS